VKFLDHSRIIVWCDPLGEIKRAYTRFCPRGLLIIVSK
jgi:hypothetical protein